jgi:GntR family transcriptional regulator
MQIEIDPLSEVPLYQQLRDRVVEGIAAGRLRPGDRLMPVRQLAAQFGINVATVGKGYDLLRAEGLIRTNRTAGSLVGRGPRPDGAGTETVDVGTWSEHDRGLWTQRLTTVIAEAIAQGEPEDAVLAAAGDILRSFADERRMNDRRNGETRREEPRDDH